MDVDTVPSGLVVSDTTSNLQPVSVDVVEPQVVKIIQKTEVRLLCSQHNPVRHSNLLVLV